MKKRRKNNKSTGRNYVVEYKNYQGKPEQIKRRASRNAAARKMTKLGKNRKGDGLDVGHKNNNPLNNSTSNLRMETEHKNRREPRLRKRKKK